MAHSMNLSKRTTVASKRCEAFVPARVVPARAPVARSAIAAAAAPRCEAASTQPARGSVVSRVAAQEASSSSTTTKQYFALVANAEFFFNDVQNESIAEQLRERVRFFKEQGREIDFWLVPEPTWLSKYPAEAKKVNRPCVALVSTDEVWITFMKLRLDRVLRFNLGAVEASEALAVGGKVPEFKKPEKWTAPYSPYSPGWWNVFLPK